MKQLLTRQENEAAVAADNEAATLKQAKELDINTDGKTIEEIQDELKIKKI
ncbi:hypothetical protein VQL36_20330 [Chengkuizengella sp. SCS-71B]|uniref:hypothetical protein n=1 Tax=Chengkuizengella sp. SCS-71B TaxID=3115290 RepID=UPI0032C239A6